MTSVRAASARAAEDLARALTEAALGGAGWAELLGGLRQACGRDVRLTTGDGRPLAATDRPADLGARLDPDVARHALEVAGTAVTAADGWRARAVPAGVPGQPALLLLVEEPAGARELELAGAAVTAVLIELVRREPGADRHPDPAAVLSALRSGAIPADVGVAAARAGLDLSRPACAAVLCHVGSRHRAWATAAIWLDRPVLRDGPRTYLLARDAADLARVHQQTQLVTGPGTVLAASGSQVSAPQRYRRSFAEADRLLGVAVARGLTALPFDDAGPLQLLLAVAPDRLSWFVERHLGAILGHAELLATLRAWLESGGSRQAVSERLHLHRNTIGYRVNQLKTLLGVDPLAPGTAAVLQTALIAADLLRADDHCAGHSAELAGHVRVAWSRPCHAGEKAADSR